MLGSVIDDVYPHYENTLAMDLFDFLYLIPFLIYGSVGCIVALRYMEKSDMMDAAFRAEKTQKGYGKMVVIVLAAIWPVLLLANFASSNKVTTKKSDENESETEDNQ